MGDLFIIGFIIEGIIFFFRNLTWEAVLYGAGIPLGLAAIIGIIMGIVEWINGLKKKEKIVVVY